MFNAIGQSQAGELPEDFQDVYDGSKFSNSYTYSTGIRSSGSEFKFNYTGTSLTLKGEVNINGSAESKAIFVEVDGVLFERVDIANSVTEYPITLPSGNKVVSIIDGIDQSTDGVTILGTWLRYCELDVNRFSYITEGQLSERVVFISDSIGNGGQAVNRTIDGAAYLFRKDNIESAVLGWGVGQYSQMASTPQQITDSVSWFTSLFSNVTTKKAVFTLGTNDWGFPSTPVAASVVSGWMADLIDALYASDNTIEITVISPLERSGEDSILKDYRTQFEAVCTARVWASYIDGFPLVPLSETTDGLHPNTTGHKTWYDAIKGSI